MPYYKKSDLKDYLAERKRNERKMRNFARSYGKSVNSLAEAKEFAAKYAKKDENYDKSAKKLHNCYSAPTGTSIHEYIDSCRRELEKEQIDPNKAFKRRKTGGKSIIEWYNERMDNLRNYGDE